MWVIEFETVFELDPETFDQERIYHSLSNDGQTFFQCRHDRVV